jgi:protein TonB
MLTIHKQTISKFLQISVLLALITCGFSWVCSAQIRVSETEGKKNIVTKVEPDFPPIAKQLNLSGRVEVDLHVDESGQVEKVDVVSGNPILAGAASGAAKRWKFQPFAADGKPTKAVVRIAFSFMR